MEICWFCETRPADPDSGREVRMVGKNLGTEMTGLNQYTTTYESRIIKVPSCKQCEFNHRKMRKGRVVPTILGTMGVLSLLFSIFTYGLAYILLIVLGAIGILTFVLLSIRLGLSTRGTSPESKRIKYPAVAELLKQGWKFEYFG